MRYSHVLGAAAVVGLAAVTAQAGMSVSLVPVVKTGAAMAADANLINTRSYDLMVTTTGGTKWASADLQFSLATSGNFAGTTFYNPTGDANIEPTSFGAENLKYDTYVSSPRRSASAAGSPAILGKAQYPVESGVGAAVFPSNAALGTSVDVAWGDTDANAVTSDGTYRVARFTVSGKGGANLSGRIGATNNSIAPVTFSNLYLPILGDMNADRLVDGLDFDAWFFNLSTTNVAGDANLDGIVDGLDFDAWFFNLSNTLPAAGSSLGAVVPEPGTLSVFSAAVLGLGLRRRK